MTNIYFEEHGKGPHVILLHGFPLNHKLWDGFAEELAYSCHVIVPDLPGFGKSTVDEPLLSLDVVANKLIEWIVSRQWENIILIGHSLGGYIALHMADQRPELFSALALFHSTAYADSPEKKDSRNKVLEFIDKHGVEKFTTNFIGPLFADAQDPGVALVQAIGREAETEPVKWYTAAMRDRLEKTKTLAEFPGLMLIISGEKDGGIPVKSIEEQATLNPNIELHVLQATAHMGMIESREQTLGIVKRFIKKVGVTS